MRRRQVLQSPIALAGALLADRCGLAATAAGAPFPSGFRWGVATAAYQIEGAVKDDGRGESVWDRFSHTPGKVKNGDNGDVACDSYHRYLDDVALMRRLHIDSYRFSISWPRIQADGSGAPNPKGIDHYKRLVGALHDAGIRPLVTLYHWDLPQALVDRGGWTRRDTAARFTDYAQIVARALGPEVGHWAIFNEPKACTHYGYLPEHNEPCGTDPSKFLLASHVINLAQGDTFRAMKAIDPAFRIGGAYDVSPMFAATDSDADRAAAERFHRFQNLWFLKPPLTGQYPEGVLPSDRLHALLGFEDGDEKRMRAELDYIGINYYSRFFVSDVPQGNGIPGLNAQPHWGAPDARERTDFGWEVYPPGLYEIVQTIARETGHRPIEITENGAAYGIGPDAQGRVRDAKRIDFLRSHLAQVARAIADGLPIQGYHCWSLLDNFEWTSGYSQRFGLVHVDYANRQKRTIKDSGQWYAKVAAGNRLV
jgi:beta-glucosidase